MVAAMSAHFAAAVPSLLSLGMLCFLPWSCRRSLSLWRAIQLYDRQPIISANIKANESKESLHILLSFVGLPFTMMLLMIFVAVTSGGNWHDGWPILANFRDAVPRIFLLVFVYRAIVSLSSTIFKPQLSISRGTQNGMLFFIRHTKKTSFFTRILHGHRNAAALHFIASILVVWAAPAFYPQSPIILVMVASCILLVAEFNIVPLISLKYSSFRGFILIPFACFAYQGLIFLLSQLFVYALERFTSSFQFNDKDTSTWGVSKMFEDVDAIQPFLLVQTFVFGLAAWFSCALVALAYRYDISQEAQSLLPDDDAAQLSSQSIQEVDSSGRNPILLDEVALSSSELTLQQLPTFRAALYTMLAIQIIGITIDAVTIWQPGVFFPTREDQLPVDMPFSISVWPFFAYPFVALAMIISVQCHPNRTFRSLWSYHEKWHTDEVTPSAKASEEPNEADVPLLELGKRLDE